MFLSASQRPVSSRPAAPARLHLAASTSSPLRQTHRLSRRRRLEGVSNAVVHDFEKLLELSSWQAVHQREEERFSPHAPLLVSQDRTSLLSLFPHHTHARLAYQGTAHHAVHSALALTLVSSLAAPVLARSPHGAPAPHLRARAEASAPTASTHAQSSRVVAGAATTEAASATVTAAATKKAAAAEGSPLPLTQYTYAYSDVPYQCVP